jgi:hypothetical protein
MIVAAAVVVLTLILSAVLIGSYGAEASLRF